MDALNTLDWILLALLAWAAVQGFLRGLVRELAALVAWVLGVWAGLRFSHRAANWLELGPEQEAAGFLVVLLLVLVAVFLLGRLLTRLVDATALSVPNKVLGLVFGVVRKAFVLSVLLNILFATEGAAWTPDRGTREGSQLYAPLRAFAPLLVPALGETTWVRNALDRLELELREAAPDRA